MADKKHELIYDNVSEEIIRITAHLATKYGAHTVTVTKIINELEVTNRVFYNRFHNVDEVLRIVYENSVVRMRRSFKSEYNKEENFFDYCMDIACRVLVNTYDVKMQFSQYMFEHDSLTENNRKWWMNEINNAFNYAYEHSLIKDIDPEILSYSVWCFCRGYNADAVSRRIPKEDALKYFKFGFGCFLEGIKKV